MTAHGVRIIMDEFISVKDKKIIRSLAARVMERANNPVAMEKKRMWYEHNDLRGQRPMFTVETWTFGQEVNYPLVCETQNGRNIEWQLNDMLMHYELICDDYAIPDHFTVYQGGYIKPFGLDSQRITAKEGLGFHVIPKINDLSEDFHVLGKSDIHIPTDAAENAQRYASQVKEVLDGIMPVKIKSGGPCASLTGIILNYMSMETLLLSLYDYPELVHKMMDMLTCDIIEFMRGMEEAGLYIVNNDSIGVPQGTYGYTNDLKPSGPDGRALLCDMWGYMDSQETSDISPGMYKDFFFPYYKRIGDMFGLLNYACCEPVHSIWDGCLSKLRNLRKLSVSPWCDEEFIGDRLRGSSVIFHRKPYPGYMGVDEVFDESGFEGHLEKTMKAAKGCKLEFSCRDVYSLKGEKDRPHKAYKLFLKAVDKYWNK